MFRVLLVDDEFQSLDIPVSPEKYAEMEFQIKKDIYKVPVVIWRDYIIEGFQRYNLYQKHHKYYSVDSPYFGNRYIAVAWSCRNQLKRTDLTANAEAWLLYRLYDVEKKIAQKKKARDQFQYRQLSPSTHSWVDEPHPRRENDTVQRRISSEYGISSATLRRYISFGESIDQLEKLFPGVRKRILTGELEVAKARAPELLQMPRQDLRDMIENPRCHRLDPPKDEIKEKKTGDSNRRAHGIQLKPGIKEMPQYDPDAELNGLTYTVGAWKSAVSKTIEIIDFDKASVIGKYRLRRALEELLAEINKLNQKLGGVF